MKKFLLSTVALIALGTVANAADLPARVYTKAPVLAPVMSWTGFYVGGGLGYGMWASDNNTTSLGGVNTLVHRDGGRGYFGTVSGGYDWQLNPTWVVGVFGDAQFGDIKGTFVGNFLNDQGTVKNKTNYAAGVRVGYLVAPNVLSYINGGYSHADFSGTVLNNGFSFGKTGFDGFFIGGGFENSLNIFGAAYPGWFMKTEYRVAQYDKEAARISNPGGGLTTFFANQKPYVQTVSTQLVYRFNWR